MAERKFLDENGAELLNDLLVAKFAEKADVSDVPSKTSDLTNDSGYKKITYSTTNLTPGTSALNTGEIYIVYE